MFMGEFSHTIDTKGRLIIPAKMREQLGETCVITRGFDSCLAVYTLEKFEDMRARLAKLSDTKSGVRALKRLLFGRAAELDFDKQGRVLIPNSLRTYAMLKKDAVVVGTSDHIEIWSREQWDRYNDEVGGNLEALVEEFDDIML
ncbi:division/cell wall cluster transcriptional repressor MraZ [Veillonella magna]|uniref:Transcriptional regulator MraZ n=2 Tax=Veillonella TaxID=29465 RepID=A0ABS2GCZ5_9FIRM|nr:division/cell wall cluster transcriptional repressor MraZ [Veillonella magna]MBD8976117.1 division/cell wall cluster transcriptional repressor MraZ [Veillonella magna]MBM6823881.1 division/cell wall cluster transcriptional repressor MraZ [Veillonella magna]MBM6912021.1 division/cell wall cluster transcriptional repressor MraZ [Veillonella magna]